MDYITSAVSWILTIKKWIYDDVKESNEEIEYIRQRIDVLESVVKPLQNCSSEENNDALKKALTVIQKQVQNCDEYKTVSWDCLTTDVVEDLRKLGKRLDQAVNDLTLVVTCFNTQKIQEIQNELRKDITYQKPGVYPITAEVETPPAPVSKATVYIKSNSMTIVWRDRKNYHLSRYEVRYNDTPNAIVSVPASCNSVILGEPNVKPGNSYTIQVRAINGQGPGEWSKAIARYFKGTPKTPGKPFVKTYHGSAVVSLRIPGAAQSNGAPVSVLIVEYRKINGRQWKSVEIDVDDDELDQKMEYRVDSLTPYTKYYFRVRLRNYYGDSHPSESVKITTK